MIRTRDDLDSCLRAVGDRSTLRAVELGR